MSICKGVIPLPSVVARGVSSGEGNAVNTLYLANRKGLALAMSEPLAGNHNDFYNMGVQFEVDGLFLNADVGFNSKDFRSACAPRNINANICFSKHNGNGDREGYFDQGLYNERYAIALTHVWTIMVVVK